MLLPDLQLVQSEGAGLRMQMADYKLYAVYYSYYIIHPDMLMSKHAILVFLNRKDQEVLGE